MCEKTDLAIFFAPFKQKNKILSRWKGREKEKEFWRGGEIGLEERLVDKEEAIAYPIYSRRERARTHTQMFHCERSEAERMKSVILAMAPGFRRRIENGGVIDKKRKKRRRPRVLSFYRDKSKRHTHALNGICCSIFFFCRWIWMALLERDSLSLSVERHSFLCYVTDRQFSMKQTLNPPPPFHLLK